MKLTNTLNRMFQAILHLPNPVSADVLLMAATARRWHKKKPKAKHVGGYVRLLRRALAPERISIVTSAGGYSLKRGPLRDRAEEMKAYRAKHGRPSRAKGMSGVIVQCKGGFGIGSKGPAKGQGQSPKKGHGTWLGHGLAGQFQGQESTQGAGPE